MHRLSAAIIAFNEEPNIARCLEALKGLADEILVVDSHSTDRTAEICVSYGCRVLLKEFAGYSAQKQFAVDSASCDWVLSIDADEVVTPELREEIRALMQSETIPADGYYLRRDLVYMGRHMHFGETSNERILRLFDRRKGRFNGALVHEKIVVDGKTADLRGKLLHHSFRDLDHQARKIELYAAKAAEELAAKGRRYPRIWVPLKYITTFITYYIIKGGFFDGYPGFMWARMRGVYASQKIARAIELHKSGKKA